MEVPFRLAAFLGDGVEFGDFCGGEEEATGFGGGGGGAGLGLAWERAVFVAVAEDIGEDGFEVLLLGAVLGEEPAGEGVRVDDLEVEAAGAFFAVGDGAAAERGEGTADECGDEFVDEGEPVALVGSEGNEGGDLVRIGGGLTGGVDGGVGREWFAFAFELLDAAHGDGAGGPVDDDGVAEGVGGGEAPAVRVGAEGGEAAAEGDDFGESGGAVGVGDVAAACGFHDVAAAPEVVEGVVDADLADAVVVGEADGFVHGGEGGALAEFAVSVPDGGAAEARGEGFDDGSGDTAAGFAAEVFVEVEGFDAVVGADAVSGGHVAEAGGVIAFLSGVATVKVGGLDERVVLMGWDDKP